jgi:hypothetical protein
MGDDDKNKGAQKTGINQDEINTSVNVALQRWLDGQKQKNDAGKEEDKKNFTPEDVTKAVTDTINSILPDVTKQITEQATTAASETFKSQHYGEINKLNSQIKVLTDAKTADEKKAADAAAAEAAKTYAAAKPDEQIRYDLSKMQTAFTEQMNQMTNVMGQITNKLHENDIDKYRTGIINANKDLIIPELVRGNSIDELNASLEVAKQVKLQQDTDFANRLGVAPDKLNEVIENVKKVTTGPTPPGDQKVVLPPNTGIQTVDGESGGSEGEVKGPKNMEEYKKNRQGYLNAAEKASQNM